MFADLQRLETGQGFIAHYPYKNGVKSVAVLLQDPRMPKNAKQDALRQLQEHFVRMNGVHVVQKDLIEKPVIYDLSADNNYVMAAEIAMSTNDMPKNLMICHDWDVYADVCTILGVTRSDHLRLAAQKGWDDPSIKLGKNKDKPRSRLSQCLSYLEKGHLGFFEPDQSFPVSSSIPGLMNARNYMERIAGESFRHVHLGSRSYHQGSDVKLISVSEKDNYAFFLPQPYCIFEYLISVGEEQQFTDIAYFVFAHEDQETGEISTMTAIHYPGRDTLLIRPSGMSWNRSRGLDYFRASLIDERHGMSYVEPQGMGQDYALMEAAILLPALAAYNDLGAPLKKYRHSTLGKNAKRIKNRDFFVLTAEDVRNRVPTSRRLSDRQQRFARAGTELHPVDAFKRRRPNSLPNSEKSVHVIGHNRGNPQFGVSSRLVTFQPKG